MRGFAGKPHCILQRLHQDAARALAAGRRRRKSAQRARLVVPARSLGALDGLFHIVAVELGQPIRCEIDHGSLTIGGELAAETAADFDQAKVRARNIGENGRCARTGRFLEHQFVSLEAEGIAGEFKRNVVVAAEREFAERVSLSFGKLGREFDGAGCKNVG